MIFVLILLVFANSDLNLVGFFTTIAACSISWLQIKKYQEQKIAYTTTAEELNFIKELSHNVKSENQLSKFVLDSENAISREHTSLIAQRRK